MCVCHLYMYCVPAFPLGIIINIAVCVSHVFSFLNLSIRYMIVLNLSFWHSWVLIL